jgi:septal ring factor EnvC (AmiA/AmiB activator)
MFGKVDLVEMLSRDIARARKKRDAFASNITALTAEIADLEVQISAENDRRERERAASEIDGIKNQLRARHLAFAPAIAQIRDATELAAAIVPEAREFTDLLEVIATEVANATNGLLEDLDRRMHALRVGLTAPEPAPAQSINESSRELQQDNDRVFRLPEWLAQRKAKSAQDRCCTAAA